MFILVQTFYNYKSTPSFATEYSLIIVSLCSKISLTHFASIDYYAGTVKALLVTVPVSLYGNTNTNQLIATAHHTLAVEALPITDKACGCLIHTSVFFILATYHFYRVCGISLLRHKKTTYRN